MGTGPKNSVGFDINIIELDDVFLVEIGSEAGRMLIGELQFTPASDFLLQAAKLWLDEACSQMGRELLNPHNLPSILLDSLDHPQWEDVAKRCLSCASCTQVCPTCFCWDIHEKPDLTNSSSQRVRVWDSCFNPDYSYISGGNTRPNTMSRYRQWLTHKFASWYHQFEVIGCVGCGRCITWCPAGIDITKEIAAITKEPVE
jgi:ferredoxin